MSRISYIYCDANVFLAYFNAEENRVQTVDQLFEDIQKDAQKKVVTSVLSITEVSHIAVERTQNKAAQDILNAIDSFWGDMSLIEFIDFNELIARKARELIRHAINLGFSLRTNDAIHLVSAQSIGISEFLTYDKRLEKFSQITNYAIKEPYVMNPRLPFTFED